MLDLPSGLGVHDRRCSCLYRLCPLAVRENGAAVAHEYTVREWRQELEREFFEFVALIRDDGRQALVTGRRDSKDHHTCLELHGWEYWTTGAPVAQTTVINRAVLEPDSLWTDMQLTLRREEP